MAKVKVKAKTFMGGFIKKGGKCPKSMKKVFKGRGKRRRAMCVKRRRAG